MWCALGCEEREVTGERSGHSNLLHAVNHVHLCPHTQHAYQSLHSVHDIHTCALAYTRCRFVT
eukprot:43731-Rhodomonas_salina.1